MAADKALGAHLFRRHATATPRSAPLLQHNLARLTCCPATHWLTGEGNVVLVIFVLFSLVSLTKDINLPITICHGENLHPCGQPLYLEPPTVREGVKATIPFNTLADGDQQ